MVSMASDTKPEEPTMVLSLRGYPEELQRSLVIHHFGHFGHALGLEHEHQRSNFWDTVGDYFDIEKMIKDPRVAKNLSDEEAKAAFERNWFRKTTVTTQTDPVLSKYDPDSIMHYL